MPQNVTAAVSIYSRNFHFEPQNKCVQSLLGVQQREEKKAGKRQGTGYPLCLPAWKNK